MKNDDRFSVSTDVARNLLSVRLLGSIDPACMHACVDQIAGELPALAKGFTILTDLSGLNAMDTHCISELERMMDLSRKAGAGTVVRVIPNQAKDIGFSILSLFHYRNKVHVLTFQSLAEAQKAIK
jgi:anti-anti-sigma regulatory factor